MMLRSAAKHRTTGRTDRLTPAARIAAAIELLEAVLVSSYPLVGGEEGVRLQTHGPLPPAPSRQERGRGGARPADAVANDFFRSRRFIGSGDRRAVSDRVWRVLRSYRRLNWWLGGHPTPRLLVTASLVLEGAGYSEVAAVFSGGRFAPALLAPSEQAEFGLGRHPAPVQRGNSAERDLRLEVEVADVEDLQALRTLSTLPPATKEARPRPVKR